MPRQPCTTLPACLLFFVIVAHRQFTQHAFCVDGMNDAGLSAAMLYQGATKRECVHPGQVLEGRQLARS